MERTDKKTPPVWLRLLLPLTLIAIWFGLGALGGPYFGRVEEVSEIDLVAFLPESAEATKVSDISAEFRDSNTIPAIVVFESTSGDIDDKKLDKLEDFTDEVTNLEAISEVSPAIVSDDKKAAIVSVPIDEESGVADVVAEIRQQASESTKDANLNSYVTGPAGFSSDLNKAFAGIDGLLLAVALSVVFVILVLVYRSPILPFVVLSTSVLALSAAILIVWQLANANIVQLNGQVQGILFILVIGAATDYALLYVARYREELYAYKDKSAATMAAWKASIEPILASGGTVIVGLMCLLLSDLGSNKALGPVGAIGIVMAMAAALTYLPSMLNLIGRKAFWPVVPRADAASQRKHKVKLEKSVWQRVGNFVSKHPRPIWVVVSIVLVACALGATQLKADGVAQSDLILGQSDARDGQEVLSRHFPDGAGSPATVVTSVDDYQEVAKVLDDDEGVSSVSVVSKDSPSGIIPLASEEASIKSDIAKEVEADLDKKRQELDVQEQQIEMQMGQVAAAQFRSQVEEQIPKVDDLVEDIYPFADYQPTVVNDQVLLQATLTNDPDSDEALETVVRLRDEVRAVEGSALVGGISAIQHDTNEASIRDRMVIIPVVLIAITFILMALLRSIIAPILLLITTVVSFGSAIGVAALLFNHVWDFPGADPAVILYSFVFLVALGIDYNIFLMTRVREEVLKIGTKKGVIKGLIVTGGVITSAGVVLAATFAALSVIPILFLFQLAFIVAFGVLLDTIIVRSLLVPALIRDIGSIVWWPSKLVNKK